MNVGKIDRYTRERMARAGIVSVDTDFRCPNPRCVGVSLWWPKPRRDPDGRIVGFQGRCAFCGWEGELPIVYLDLMPGHGAMYGASLAAKGETP